MTHEAERRVIIALVQRLSRRFPEMDRAVISEQVSRIYQRFDRHSRREFVPILVEDADTDLLRANIGPEAAAASSHAAPRPAPKATDELAHGSGLIRPTH